MTDLFVIPAKAGIQLKYLASATDLIWTPASAGVTEMI